MRELPRARCTSAVRRDRALAFMPPAEVRAARAVLPTGAAGRVGPAVVCGSSFVEWRGAIAGVDVSAFCMLIPIAEYCSLFPVPTDAASSGSSRRHGAFLRLLANHRPSRHPRQECRA
jgi:hypothetical protein